MSDGNNDVLILMAAAGAFLYLKSRKAQVQAVNNGYQGGVATMPGSVGSGNNQVKVGAVLGFLQGIAGSWAPNTSSGYVQQPYYPADYGAINDAVSDPWAAAGGVIDNIMY